MDCFSSIDLSRSDLRSYRVAGQGSAYCAESVGGVGSVREPMPDRLQAFMPWSLTLS